MRQWKIGTNMETPTPMARSTPGDQLGQPRSRSPSASRDQPTMAPVSEGQAPAGWRAVSSSISAA